MLNSPFCGGGRRLCQVFFLPALFFLLVNFSMPLMAQDANLKKDVARHLQLVEQEMGKAMTASKRAKEASSVDQLKRQVDIVFEAVWGIPADLDEGSGAVATHGWKNEMADRYR